MEDEILVSTAAFYMQAELPCDTYVVSNFRMRIERKMKCKEVQIVLDECTNARAPDTDDSSVFAAPKISVMDQQRVRAGMDARSNELG